MSHKKLAFALTFAAAALGAGVLAAQASPPPGDHPPGPPPFAFTACEGKQDGDVCTVSFGQETVEGSCATHGDDRLFCLPDDMPPPPAGDHRGPPPRED